MTWQLSAALSALCLALIGILVASIPLKYMGFPLVVFYGLAASVTALTFLMIGRDRTIFDMNGRVLMIAAAMGALLCIATSLQVFAIRNAHSQYPWVMTIGSASPVLILAYAAIHKPAIVNVGNLSGFILVIVGLCLIAWYSPPPPAPEAQNGASVLAVTKP
jgi:hypothetical protein